MRGRQNHNLRQQPTENSQMSLIDYAGKVEALFLEKFFRYVLNDRFSKYVTNAFEEHFETRAVRRTFKQLTSQLYRVKLQFQLQQFENKVNQFYKAKSRTLQERQFGFAFKFQYSSTGQTLDQIQLRPGEVLYVQVKIRAEIQSVENLPRQLLQEVEEWQEGDRTQQSILEQFVRSHYEHVNVVLVYFGDVNFNLFRHDQYRGKYMRLAGKVYKVRFLVFYVSKLALVESFKAMNNIDQLESINDLHISLYELRRTNRRDRHRKEQDQLERQKRYVEWRNRLVKLVFIVSVLGVGFGLFYRFVL